VKRPHTYRAPAALILLTAAAAAVALIGAKALPASAGEQAVKPALGSNLVRVAENGHVHYLPLGAHGYNRPPGGGTAPKTAANLTPTAYSEPHVIRSHHGVLRVTFRPHDGSTMINGERIFGTRTFTGTYPGPTLKLRPGDTIRMKFINGLDENTNLHFHGFRVSPSGLADNVLRTIAPAVTSKITAPGHTARIVVHIPKNHEHGLYWYHPHFHGNVDGQVYPGLAGMIVVGNVLADLPKLKHIKQHVMALQSVQLDGNQLVNVNNVSSVNAESTFVNGHYQPTLSIRPGELQLWRVANISNDFWYKLRLGGQKLRVIGEDGNPVASVYGDSTLLLPPGKRFEFLVRGPKHGRYRLESIPFDQGFANFPRRTLLHLVSKGPAAKIIRIPKVASPAQKKIQQATLHDRVDKRRVLTFSIKKPFPKNFQGFLINGKLFNIHRVNEKVTLGHTEEWLLRNTSSEDHPFHIHTNDFLVERVNGHKVAIHGFQDVVRIPREEKGKPGTVLIRMRFRSFTGKAVFHCHILFHEDNAMMGIIQFTRPKR
jgi:suppressor of ftsI